MNSNFCGACRELRRDVARMRCRCGEAITTRTMLVLVSREVVGEFPKLRVCSLTCTSPRHPKATAHEDAQASDPMDWYSFRPPDLDVLASMHDSPEAG